MLNSDMMQKLTKTVLVNTDIRCDSLLRKTLRLIVYGFTKHMHAPAFEK